MDSGFSDVLDPQNKVKQLIDKIKKLVDLISIVFLCVYFSFITFNWSMKTKIDLLQQAVTDK